MLWGNGHIPQSCIWMRSGSARWPCCGTTVHAPLSTRAQILLEKIPTLEKSSGNISTEAWVKLLQVC